MSLDLGAATDYKILLGNTSLDSINMTRVNSRILVVRPKNYRSYSLREVGPLVAPFPIRWRSAARSRSS